MDFTDPTTDRERGALYLAEDQAIRVMRSPSRAVRLAGTVQVLPPLLSFGTLHAVQQFTDLVLRHPTTLAEYPDRGPVKVVAKRGFRSASYAHAEIRVPVADPRGSWALAQPVILHECAHHLLGAPGHGRGFRRCLLHLYELHLGDAAAQLLHSMLAHLDDIPDPAAPGASDPASRKVAALLAKAASTTSAPEAEAYLAKANLVAHRHSVDLAVAALERQGAQQATHRMVTIGAPRASGNKLLVSLFASLARPWRIPVDVGPQSTYVLAYGMPGDLDHLESMYATAGTMMTLGAAEHARSGAWRGTTYLAPVGSGRYERREVTSVVARNAFCAGFIDRLAKRVAADVAKDAHQGTDQQPDLYGPKQAELALRAKEVAIREYHRRASRARGSWRGSASAAGSAAVSRRAGAAAADSFRRPGLRGGTPKELTSGG